MEFQQHDRSNAAQVVSSKRARSGAKETDNLRQFVKYFDEQNRALPQRIDGIIRPFETQLRYLATQPEKVTYPPRLAKKYGASKNWLDGNDLRVSKEDKNKAIHELATATLASLWGLTEPFDFKIEHYTLPAMKQRYHTIVQSPGSKKLEAARKQFWLRFSELDMKSYDYSVKAGKLLTDFSASVLAYGESVSSFVQEHPGARQAAMPK